MTPTEIVPHLLVYTQIINTQIMALYEPFEPIFCLAIQVSFEEFHSQTSALMPYLMC